MQYGLQPMLALLGVLAAIAPATTLDRTVVASPTSEPGGDFVFLADGPGEPTTVRDDLAQPLAGRAGRRRSLAYFAQLSDFQLTDEESPARVEVLDQAYSAFSSAFRPQEALLPFVVDASVRRVNAQSRSVHSGKRMGFALTTGDNADNSQRNETRWVQTLLDGGPLNPNSGTDAPCPGVDPAEAPRYTGVQDYDDYVESGVFYDPDQPAGQFAAWPAYTGLMDRAQQPFEAAGLDVPSYVALGNHDALVQGNQSANSAFQDVATGCVKAIGPALAPGTFPGQLETMLGSSPAGAVQVPSDPERALITRAEYRALMAPGKDAHGFAFVDADELAASGDSAAYYAFSPAPGLRFIGLDTTAAGGVTGIAADGNLDAPQFAWLKGKVEAAAKADELVVLFSHHGPTSLTANIPDEVAGSCTDAGCDADPRSSQPIALQADVVAYLHTQPHVIAWIAGHSHVNDVAEYGSFWVVRTSAEADWPHQDRLLELFDNRDGTLSLFGTLIDNAAPAAAPPAGDAAGFTTDQLASLARTFGYNDPQAGLAASGELQDRNVELLIPDPRAKPAPAPKRLKARVRPRRVKAGIRTTLRIRVRRGLEVVRGARVRLADRVRRTGRRGRARIRVTLRKPGRRAVKVFAGGDRALARFRVVQGR